MRPGATVPAEAASSFARIKALVIARTLHHYYEDKDVLLQDRVRRRMAVCGCDETGYLALLRNDSGRTAEASEAEWTALEADITIGETFFFRYAEQFAALSDIILPTLIRDRAPVRRLRIWSAGCASGAEPYSVAILLHRLLGDALPDWSISILGTDISASALATARRGEFGGWALRSLSETERRRDFLPVDHSGSRRWQLRPVFRDMVRFERRNLLDLIDSDAPPGWSGYDLVLCRNVLIYFHADRVRELVWRFGESLMPDGWLLLGHAEAAGLDAGGLRPVALDGTVAWMRAVAPSAIPPARVARAGPAVVAPAGPVPAVASRIAPIQAPAPDRATEADMVERVRRMADGGQPDAALALCRLALRTHPVSSHLFFYAALVARTLGAETAAEADFRRAIYLCKEFAMAHYHLGLLLIDAGRIETGRRSIADAGGIVRSLPHEQVLACGDGMTAGRLRMLTRLDWITGPAPP